MMLLWDQHYISLPFDFSMHCKKGKHEILRPSFWVYKFVDFLNPSMKLHYVKIGSYLLLDRW